MSDMNDVVGLRGAWKTLAETEYEFEPATGTLWGYMRQRGNPCFNLALLKEIRTVGNELATNGGHIEFEGAMHQVHTYVGASRTPRIFSLGGDLALFLLLIRSRDRDALAQPYRADEFRCDRGGGLTADNCTLSDVINQQMPPGR